MGGNSLLYIQAMNTNSNIQINCDQNSLFVAPLAPFCVPLGPESPRGVFLRVWARPCATSRASSTRSPITKASKACAVASKRHGVGPRRELGHPHVLVMRATEVRLVALEALTGIRTPRRSETRASTQYLSHASCCMTREGELVKNQTVHLERQRSSTTPEL